MGLLIISINQSSDLSFLKLYQIGTFLSIIMVPNNFLVIAASLKIFGQLEHVENLLPLVKKLKYHFQIWKKNSHFLT